MQWNVDVNNDDIETVNVFSTTRIYCNNRSLESMKPRTKPCDEKKKETKKK